ncbi:MAG: NADH:flavin oxidoreductase [Bacteroidales bacterium]
MKKHKKRTTRRRFIRISSCGAVTLLAGKSLIAYALKDRNNISHHREGTRVHYKTFSKGQIGSLSLKNRLVRSATYLGTSPGCIFSDHGLSVHRALAEGGVGLIITGHMTVVPNGHIEDNYYCTCIHEDQFISHIGRIAETVHQSDDSCRAIAQITHLGMRDIGDRLVSPSGIPWPSTDQKLHTLSTGEVKAIVNSFVQAAVRVKKAGFDGVQLHCAHAYLLSTFLSPYFNQRTDQFGGSLEKRVRIVREIVDGIKTKAGEDFPVLVKVNCNDDVEEGMNMDRFPAFAGEIAETGVDAIEISGNDTLITGLNDREEQSYYEKYADRLDLGIPVIITGGNKNIEYMEEIVQQGKVDFFGLARPLIREPSLPNRWLEGNGGAECDCISCNLCFDQMMKGEITRCHMI